MKEMDRKPIVINLHESSNAKKFKYENLIHQREFDRAKELIDKRINRSDSKDKIRYNDTISILGSRGSGKTTFLYSILAFYKGEIEKKTNEYINAVEVLDIIDPTLIEEKGHVFLTILSLIEEAVCKKIKLNDCSPSDSDYCLKKEWKDKLRKLADGLPSIDGIGLNMSDTNWQDAEFIMDRGLKSVKAAKDLEANFNDLVACALKTLEKKAFIITLDDIDVDFRKGWPVLETIRKYLTSPQIIVLLSGDLKLYSKAIRKQQWKNFGKALLINEADRLHKKYEYNDLVTEMESQYLQKIIKPENRIRLTTLHEKINLYGQKIVLEDTIIPDIEIMPFYNQALAIFGIHNEYQAEAYTSFLLNLPIRTQIQFLEELEELNVSETTNVIDPFLSDLYEKEVDVDLARLPKMLNAIILQLLIKEQILSDAYQLQPTTTGASLNGSLTAMSFLFSQQVKSNPQLIFDYLIKIGYVRNLLSNIGYAENTDKKGTSLLKPSIEGLCYHSGIFQDKVLRDVVGNMNAYIESIPGGNENKNGIIYLKATAKRDKGSKIESKGRIDYEFGSGENKITTQQQTLAFIPLSISEFIEKKYSSLTFSIYRLLASIGELIRKADLNDLENGFLELSQLRTYPMVSFEKGLMNLTNEDDYNEIKTIKDPNGNSELITWFSEWRSAYSSLNKENSYSPHLLGKISTRIYYSFNSIKNEKDCNLNLGVATHRRIIALMNAILIEDVRENCVHSQGLNINNAVTEDDVFINNLDFANSIKGSNFSFSRWMLSCPLFLLYLDCSFLKIKSFKDFIFPDNYSKMDEYMKGSIYVKLIEVDLKDQNPTGTKKINTYVLEGHSVKFNSDDNREKEKALEILINNKVPYSIFAQTNGQTIRQRNDNIRRKLNKLFPNEKIYKDGINKFAKFLKSYKGVNKAKVDKWKQAQ